MKNSAIKNIQMWMIVISSLLCCWNGSIVNTNTASNAQVGPDVNFYGRLQDHQHTAYVESILIGGKYESIPFYQHSTIPQQGGADIDPKQNKSLLNLQDIKSISLAHPENPSHSSIKINNRTYIQIMIETLHGSQKPFLVESTRKISCKEVEQSSTAAPSINQSRDISFVHVKKLSIEGYKSNHPYQAPALDVSQKAPTPTAAQPQQVSTDENILKEKDELQANTAQILDSIEENVKNMPLDNPSAFKTMQSTILVLLKSLRDQLQKFLDMIK